MGKQWKQWDTLFWGGSKITSDGNCSHEIKRRLLLGRKAMTNLDSILKSRDINLPTKVCLVKDMAFPVVMYGCESWTIKRAEPWIIDAFELWCWRKLLRVPWTARRSIQSILKEKSVLCIHWKDWKDPDAGKGWRWEEKGTTEDEMVGWHHQLNKCECEQALGVGDTGKPDVLQFLGLQRIRHDWVTELNGTENLFFCEPVSYLP